MTDLDQEKHLDLGLNTINNQIYHLSKAIENNDLRSSLKRASLMLAELKTSFLTPRNYYNLFTVVMDELQFLEQFFKEEYRRGRKIKHLYDSVQQSQSIIPRLYLMITAGRVYIESGDVHPKEMMFELLNAIKGVQNPTRGLFLRYYLLKMMKDKLPDKEEDIDSTLKFILQNLEDMNRLWIRLSTGCSGNEKILREKERNELKVLIGENIIRISDLNSLTIEKYKADVLPRLISILLESKDSLSQQYLLECIIHAFTETFNISCMGTILETLSKVVSSVDIKSLFINLMEKLSKFISEEERRKKEGNDEGENMPEINIQSEIEKIFSVIQVNIEKLIDENMKGEQTDELKIIELQVAFMKFTLNCCPSEKKVDTVNHIIKSVLSILKSRSSSSGQLGKDSIKQIQKILNLPLENKISIFKIPLFSELMEFLDYNSRSTLALNLLENLAQLSKKKVFISDEESEKKPEIQDQSNVLDSIEKVTSLLSYLKPLTENSEDSSSIDKKQFAFEQLAVCKLVYAISEKNPQKNYAMLKVIQNVFEKGGHSRMIISLPVLINTYINLVNTTYLNYHSNEDSLKEKTPYHISYLENVDTSCFESESEVEAFCILIYNNIVNLITEYLMTNEYNLSFQLLTSVVSSINTNSNLKCNEIAEKLVRKIFSFVKEIKKDQSDNKLQYFILTCNFLLNIRCIEEDLYFEILTSMNSVASSFAKRYEQSKAMLAISNLYYHDSYTKNEEKCKDAISKAAEYADYSMSTNTQACLNLYILIINKFLFYVQKGAGFVSAKKLIKQIEKVNNCIKSIKSENQSSDFLSEVERFFESTIEYIEIKKKANENPIYAEIKYSLE